jgi:outer membrane immunogenic protein
MIKAARMLTVFLLLFQGLAAFAQLQTPKVEASADYSLVVYNPDKNFSGTRYLNGGGGALVYNFAKYFGVKGEFQGYASTTAQFTIPAGQVLPQGIYRTQANMFTYLFGPQINFRMKGGKLFLETLFGGAYSNGYANLYKSVGFSSGSASTSGFAMAIGAGYDYKYRDSISFRIAELDYFLTRYSIAALGTNNQSNFRYIGGVVFNFGGK